MAARLTTYLVVAIVAATLIAGLIVGAQRGDDTEGPVDLIIHHARIYTATGEGAMAEAIAIRGNQILRVGSDREISRLERPQTTVIDAKGAAVLPGFNDAHLELVEGGATLDRIDLLDATTVEDVQRRIRDWSDANPDRPWILGRGWRQEVFGDGAPTRQMLDLLVPERPVLLLSADGRTAWVNSRALQLARVTRQTANPAHGVIVRDPRSGDATGLLKESAVALVDRLVPAPTAPERERALRAAIAEAHRFGITSVQDVSGTLPELAAYADARRSGDLRLRVYSAVPIAADLPDADLDRLQTEIGRYADDPLFKAGAMSLTLDDDASGSGTEKTATADKPAARFDADLLNRLVRRLDARGWQVMTEANGENAVRMTLDAYEHAAKSNPERTRERRHRIEGSSSIAETDVARFAPLSVLASLRPFERPVVETEAPSPSPVAALARQLATARGHLAFGSGWPAASLNPMLGLSAAVKASGLGDDRDRLSLKSAVDAYTSGAAWASFDEQRKGTLAPGMLADIVVLSDDIFKSPSADLAGTRVEMTIFDGKVVYKRGQRDTN